MTPGAREEIEKEVNKLLNSFEYAGRRVIALPLKVTEIKERMVVLLLTQVEKARAEEREKISVYLEGTETWEGREFAKTIRNKLEK